MKATLNMSGQWLGHFEYGPEYGDLYGEKVLFSLVLDDLGEGQFSGTGHDLEGIGIHPEVAIVRGYLEGNSIHFVKEYPGTYALDEEGNLVEFKSQIKPILTYDGEFNERTKAFSGTWEIEVNLGPTLQGDLLEFCTGKWEMSRT